MKLLVMFLVMSSFGVQSKEVDTDCLAMNEGRQKPINVSMIKSLVKKSKVTKQ